MKSKSIFLMMMAILTVSSLTMAQGQHSDSLIAVDSPIAHDSALKISAAQNTIAMGIDSTAIKAMLLNKNRLLAAAYDDSTTQCRKLRSLCFAGIVVGSAITVVGYILSASSAQEDLNRQSSSTGGPSIVWFWNIPGIFLGIPLSTFSAYKYVTLGSRISVYEWKKRKLKLSFSGNGSSLAGCLSASF